MRPSQRALIRRCAAGLGLHRPWYVWQNLRGRRALRDAPSVADLVMILNEDCRDWIMDRICREVAQAFRGSVRTCYFPEPIPAARAYFVGQYSFLAAYVKANPSILAAKTVVFHTHSSHVQLPMREFVYLMGRMHRIVCMNSGSASELARIGIPESRLETLVGGADPGLFHTHQRGGGVVGMCSFFYPRKNGELILEVARRMPEHRFLLVGQQWEKWECFKELTGLPNFSYIDRHYQEYPALYAKMDVFLSPSKLEGGPIPLIEAMMSNVVPVATRTGFAPDIIRHGENGFLFESEAHADEVCILIRQAMKLETDVRKTVQHLSWDNFARQIVEMYKKVASVR